MFALWRNVQFSLLHQFSRKNVPDMQDTKDVEKPSTAFVTLLITLKHSFGKHRKQRGYFSFCFFNQKVDFEGRFSGTRVFSAKPLFSFNKVVQLNKFDYCLCFLFTCLMKDIEVEISSSLFFNMIHAFIKVIICLFFPVMCSLLKNFYLFILGVEEEKLKRSFSCLWSGEGIKTASKIRVSLFSKWEKLELRKLRVRSGPEK